MRRVSAGGNDMMEPVKKAVNAFKELLVRLAGKEAREEKLLIPIEP